MSLRKSYRERVVVVTGDKPVFHVVYKEKPNSEISSHSTAHNFITGVSSSVAFWPETNFLSINRNVDERLALASGRVAGTMRSIFNREMPETKNRKN